MVGEIRGSGGGRIGLRRSAAEAMLTSCSDESRLRVKTRQPERAIKSSRHSVGLWNLQPAINTAP